MCSSARERIARYDRPQDLPPVAAMQQKKEPRWGSFELSTNAFYRDLEYFDNYWMAKLKLGSRRG